MVKKQQEKEQSSNLRNCAEPWCGGETKAYLGIQPLLCMPASPEAFLSTLPLEAPLNWWTELGYDLNDCSHNGVCVEELEACLAPFLPLTQHTTVGSIVEALKFGNVVGIILSREQLHHTICDRFKWKQLIADPWGNQDAFDDWLSNVLISLKDNPEVYRRLYEQLLLWAINETRGRVYFADGILRDNVIPLTGDNKIENISSKVLLDWDGQGSIIYQAWKEYAGKSNFQYHEPLPVDFIIDQLIHTYIPCYLAYRQAIQMIFLGFEARKEMDRRDKINPEGGRLARYMTARSEKTQQIIQELVSPKPYQAPDNDEAWDDFVAPMRPRLQQVGDRFKDIYPDAPAHEAEIKLFQCVTDWEQPEDKRWAEVEYPEDRAMRYLAAGLDGKLAAYLVTAVKHDLVDDTRSEEALRDHQFLEADSQYAGDEDNGVSILSSLHSADDVQEATLEPLTLEDLNLDLSRLSPTELTALKEGYIALNQGYEFDSKDGLSLRDWWGDEYHKKIKAFERARDKLTGS